MIALLVCTQSAAKVIQRCFRSLEAKRAAEKAERNRLEGPDVRVL